MHFQVYYLMRNKLWVSTSCCRHRSRFCHQNLSKPLEKKIIAVTKRERKNHRTGTKMCVSWRARGPQSSQYSHRRTVWQWQMENQKFLLSEPAEILQSRFQASTQIKMKVIWQALKGAMKVLPERHVEQERTAAQCSIGDWQRKRQFVRKRWTGDATLQARKSHAANPVLFTWTGREIQGTRYFANIFNGYQSVIFEF